MPQHIISVKTYVTVCAVLLVLTLVTILASSIDLGAWSSVVALAIAACKAILIILYFMHVRFSSGLTRLVIAGGVLWLGILILGTMDDFLTRGWLPIAGK